MPEDEADNNKEIIEETAAGFLVLNKMRNIASTVKDAKKVGGISLEIDGIEAGLDDWLDLCVDITNEMFLEHADNPKVTRPSFKKFYQGEPGRDDLLFIKNILLQMNLDLMEDSGFHPKEIKGRDVGDFLNKMLKDDPDGDDILEIMAKELGIPREQILEDIEGMRDVTKSAEDLPAQHRESLDETVAEIDPQDCRMTSNGSAELRTLLNRELPEPFREQGNLRITFNYDGQPIKDLQKAIDEIDMTLSLS